MAAYDKLGKYYDLIMGDQREPAQRVRNLLREYHPHARTVLDLGCGTGSILSHLAQHYEVAGVDLSTTLLAMARRKLPRTPFYQGDMKSFDLGCSFDAVVCLRDAVNHLRRLSDWHRAFARVHRHLHVDGLFVFDINTERKLQRLAALAPQVHEFRGHLMVTDVSLTAGGLAAWHLKVFEPMRGGLYQLSEETIYERSFPTAHVRNVLREAGFKGTKTFDLDRGRLSPQSERVYFVCWKRE